MRHLGRIRYAEALPLASLLWIVSGCGPGLTTTYDDVVVAPRPEGVAPGRADPTVVPTAPEERTKVDGADTGTAAKEPVASGPLEISVEEAVLLALENNRGFSVQRLGPARRATYEDEAAAAFDPSLAVSGSVSRGEDVAGDHSASGSVSLGLSQAFSSGAQVNVGLDQDHSNPSMSAHSDSARVGLGVTQPLLRGAGRRTNMASIRQAALDTRSSEYELRGFALSLVAQVEVAYWDYALARRQIEIYEESLRLAKKQQQETQDRIAVGKLAETEIAIPRAEVASRREALISARGALEAARIRLVRLMNPPGTRRGGEFWERKILLETEPSTPVAEPGPVAGHVETAVRSRPDVNQARLAIERGEIELVKTKNGLLPRLDLFVNLGKSGYADSFDGSVENLNGEGHDMSAGLTFEWAIGNRAARARNRRALFEREEAAHALDNLVQLAEVDVRTAYVAATTAREQIEATAATRALKEETLRAETEKLRVGFAGSSAFQVALARRDVLASQISEVQAMVDYLKALVELYRLDGSLLDRRGIVAPGPALTRPGAASQRRGSQQ